MNQLTLKANKRDVLGRKVKKLRREGLIPANLFGKKITSTPLSVALIDFLKVYEEAGETGLVNLTIEGDKKERAVLISNIQNSPVEGNVLHVDFHQVDLKEKVTAEIPVEVEGESPAEKSGIGTVVQHLQEIEVEALPQDLPERFVVDAAELVEVDQAVYVKDLKHDRAKVEIQGDLEAIVVKVEPPQKEEVVEPVVSEEVAEGESAPTEAAGEEVKSGEENKTEDSSKE